MIDEYTTVAAPVRAETRVMGSKFLAHLTSAPAAEAALGVLETVRKTHHDATHHCYAYRIGLAGAEERFSDAGEPSGTAGKPILLALRHAELTDAVLIVTRYFGGTKLGVGGLRRAYAEAAGEAIRRARREPRIITEKLQLLVPQELLGDVISAAARAGGTVAGTEYGPEALLTIEIRRSRMEEVRRMLIDRTSGKARVAQR